TDVARAHVLVESLPTAKLIFRRMQCGIAHVAGPTTALVTSFSNLVVSLPNHGKTCAAALRRAQDWAGICGSVPAKNGSPALAGSRSCMLAHDPRSTAFPGREPMIEYGHFIGGRRVKGASGRA